MIAIKNLVKRYKNSSESVLKGISLSFNDTGLYYLIGKSGAGKSTLLAILGGMDFDYSGEVFVDGKELKSFTEKEKADYRFESIGFVFQDFKADEDESVKANLLKALAITDLNEEEKLLRINEALKKIGLEEKLNKKFKSLSGGEKKRISLARALIRDNKILLCDEPVASLNEGLRKDVTEILLKESQRRLVIVITHDVTLIPDSAYQYELVNGKIKILKESKKSTSSPLKLGYQRKKYGGKSFLSSLFSSLISKRKFLIVTLFTLAISLFSITFSFLLSNGVSSSMKESLSAYMDDNSFVIKNRDDSYKTVDYETADYNQLLYLKNRYPDYIDNLSAFYLESFSSFQLSQDFFLQCNNRHIEMNRLSLDSFSEALTYSEADLPGFLSIGIGQEEVILGLKEADFKSLYLLIYQEPLAFIDDEIIEETNNEIRKKNLTLQLKADKSEWKYHLSHSFKVRGAYLSDKTSLINPSIDFSDHFVKEVLHFKTILMEEEKSPEEPWTIKRGIGLRLKKRRTADFLKAFLLDPKNDPYVLAPLISQNYYDRRDSLTHNRFLVYKDYLSKISISAINSFASSQGENVRSVSYSSPVYTYTASGYISGFKKPFFISKYKDKLNEIEDNSFKTKNNLGDFQGSLIEVPNGVIKADLFSAMDSNGLSFSSYSKDDVPIAGYKPNDYSGIMISSSLANELFLGSDKALDESLSTLMLERTVKKGEDYLNYFSSGELKITGVIQNEKKVIYQDYLFPLSYAFSISSLQPNEIRATEAVLEVDLKKHNEDYYQRELNKIGDYQGSFPMLKMTEEIKKTLNQLSSLFLGFAFLSLISSAFLLGLSLFLIIRKEQKEIGILLSLGYYKKEIGFFFLVFSLLLGLIGFLLSLLLSLMTEKVLKSTLLDLLKDYQASLLPYLISFLTAFFLTALIGSIIRLKIAKIEPIDSFLK